MPNPRNVLLNPWTSIKCSTMGAKTSGDNPNPIKVIPIKYPVLEYVNWEIILNGRAYKIPTPLPIKTPYEMDNPRIVSQNEAMINPPPIRNTPMSAYEGRLRRGSGRRWISGLRELELRGAKRGSVSG